MIRKFVSLLVGVPRTRVSIKREIKNSCWRDANNKLKLQ